jgi:hypothetical protein
MNHYRPAILAVPIIAALLVFASWARLTVRQSGQGYTVGDHLVVGTFGYSDGGDRLRFAIFRTWPKDHPPMERFTDTRMQLDSLGWPCVRSNNGRMMPVSANGNVYFFDGDHLKTMTVRMNEHTDTLPLASARSIDEFWAYLQNFEVKSR